MAEGRFKSTNSCLTEPRGSRVLVQRELCLATNKTPGSKEHLETC